MVRALAIAVVLASCADQNLALFTPVGVDAGADAGFDAGQPFGVERVATSWQHACATRQGALYCWGSNVDGELGVGDVQPRSRPTALDAGTGWVELGVGYGATCGRKTDGSVWCWGNNDEGQLGLGPVAARSAPSAQVPLPSPSLALSMHFNHACAIGMDRVLRCWGQNLEGQLGLDEAPPFTNRSSPVAVAGGGQWQAVSAGQGHTCGLQTNGTVWCWGRNDRGHLGQGAGSPQQLRRPTQIGADADWAQVRASQNSTCALKTNGSLWCWGESFSEPIGTRQIVTPERIGADTSWTAVEIETFSICGLKTGGALFCWGRNDEGQLGLGNNTSLYTPQPLDGGSWSSVAVGRFHHCAIDEGHSVYCTGENNVGQLGLGDNLRRNALTPVRF